MPNRLVREKSPYLLQHAHNPVDWFPWGHEALERAQSEDKPIFLSVGYSACHWCHVMERESFENTEVAEILNQYFVSIKVDREERPDVDEIYMTAVQMMTGHGGWPMSVFLTPDGRPFYGGTYFPPESIPGRIGFKSLAMQLAAAWEERRVDVEQVASEIVENLQKTSRQRPLASPSNAPRDPQALLHAALDDLQSRFDAHSGGFGGAPKFPPHHALRLLTLIARHGSGDAPLLLLTTLDKMALGGIYDHVGGGFHRYATDAIWLLPHFEKMLYDNALLARVYAEAFDLTGRLAYARIARETCDWVLRDMTAPNGGFYSALDADSEGVEGKYYVWSRTEAEMLSGTALCDTYQILATGNYRDEATHQRTGQNIPHLHVGEGAAYLPDTLTPELASGLLKLRAVRESRVAPQRDEKILTGWNGLMIGALATVGQYLREPRYLDAARAAAEFCLTTLRPEGALLHRWADGEAAIPAFLDDYAYLADGLLDLAEATGEPRWTNDAAMLMDTLLASFWDDEDSGFFYASEAHHERLIARSKDLFDGALPSSNGVAARVLQRLGGSYAQSAERMLLTFHGVLLRASQGMSTLIEAANLSVAYAEPVIETSPAAVTLLPGASHPLTFTLDLTDSWHINTKHPERDYLIPTVATLSSDLPAAVGPVQYPEETHHGGIAVYAAPAHFIVPVVLAHDAAPGVYTLTLSIAYQPCSETACLAPTETTFSIAVTVA